MSGRMCISFSRASVITYEVPPSRVSRLPQLIVVFVTNHARVLQSCHLLPQVALSDTSLVL